MLLPLAIFLLLIHSTGAELNTPRKKPDERDNLWFHFVTRPDIQAPKFNVSIYDAESLASGYYFISPYEDADNPTRGMPWVGPYIYDGRGDLIWAGTPLMDHFKLWDFKVSEVDGSPMLSGLWEKDFVGVLINDRYEIIKTIPIGLWNMHEFNVIDNGGRVLVTTKEERYELDVEVSKTVGFNGKCRVTADGFQDIDMSVDPPQIAFDWRGIDHMSLNESVMRPDQVDRLCSHNWDINHFNSVDRLPDGDYLVSSRHSSTIYKISHFDGSIVWRLGGQQSDFLLPKEAQFTRQHNARFISQNSTHMLISLFDNAYGWTDDSRQGASRGLILALSPNAHSVEIVQQALSPMQQISESRGSTQLLPNGNLFVCWVDQTRLSEHSPDGRLLMHSVAKAPFAAHIDSYRAYKFPWVGRPKAPPDVSSASFTVGTGSVTSVFVSWNGATEVASWRLYASNADGSDLKRLKQKLREGFETRIMHHEYVKHVVLEALDREERSIGRSKVVHTLPPVEEEEKPNDSWVLSVLTNPISGFVTGFVAATVVCLVVLLVMRSKTRWQWPVKHTRFEGAGREEQEALVRPEEENEYEEDIELRDKT